MVVEICQSSFLLNLIDRAKKYILVSGSLGPDEIFHKVKALFVTKILLENEFVIVKKGIIGS